MAGNGLLNNVVRKLCNFFYIQYKHCGNTCVVTKSWKWDIALITKQARHTKYAVLILNRPITQSPEFMKNLWNNATVTITIDGGTMQWNNFLSKLPEDMQKTMRLPDLITGDFDSISQDILKYYQKQGCKTIHTPDQDYTDFTKALIELNKYCQQNDTHLEHVMAIGQNSGRLDQILGNIQTLFLVKELELLSAKTNVYLVTDDAISWLLSPGEHVISIPEEALKNKHSWCSLIPVGESCLSVTTSGLKWNLDNQTLKFGGIVSTSNTFDGSEKVTIKCSHTVLWSMKVPTITGSNPLFD